MKESDDRKMKLNLIVLRVTDLERSREFYEALGLEFVQERHGTGPMHYACDLDGTIFELYPRKNADTFSSDGVRLGFTVPALDQTINLVTSIGGRVNQAPIRSTWGMRAVVCDPDGSKVELLGQTADA